MVASISHLWRRRWAGMLLTAMAAGTIGACGSPSGPSGPRLNVTVRDDAGLFIERMPVVVRQAGVTLTTTRTDGRGQVAVAVPEAGSYEVQVVPRAGYQRGRDPLTKLVSVNGAGAVQFTVYREGLSTGDSCNYPDPCAIGSP
ncbi:MAG: hypothetical protein K2Y26_06385 [Gemmatimonadaceae bacterium]|nr:hypothetical protein [Gemmatimonadaceae bacterium]